MVKGRVLNVKWGHLLVAIRRVLDEQVLRDAAVRYFIKIYARHNPQEQSGMENILNSLFLPRQKY